MILALLTVLYAVHAVSLPVGMTVDLTPTPGGQSIQLSNASLSRGGALAIIMYPQNSYSQLASELLVIRPDGSQVVLTRPPDSTLSKYFAQSALVNGHEAYPGTRFAGVRLARDGTPLATVEFPFSGAYSGADQTVFAWNGRRWTNALSVDTPSDWSNVTIGAADEPWRAAYNVTYTNTFVNMDLADSDPHYQEIWTFLRDGMKQTRIGYGSAMAMRRDVVVGFSAGQSSIAKSTPQPCTAWMWRNDRRIELGPGIAYGINSSGDVVGDDEATLGGDGFPTSWRDGQIMRLSSSQGAALAIGDDGTIVGKEGYEGFIIRGDDLSRTLVLIDTLLGQSGWHVSGIYGIAASGRLLAVGNRIDGQSHLLLLDPRT